MSREPPVQSVAHGHLHPDDEHAHAHGPDAARSLASGRRRVLVGVMLAGLVVTAIEVGAGLAANSLVLLADAAHYATDLLGLLLAFAAISWAARPASIRKTFGYHRAEVVAAFLNALALWGLSIFLVFEAVERLRDPPRCREASLCSWAASRSSPTPAWRSCSIARAART